MSGLKNKARTPTRERGIATREKLVNAAWQLFTDKGYFKTNAKDIAMRAGVATGSFYAYFNNKKELIIELLRRFYKDGTEKMLLNYKQHTDTMLTNDIDAQKNFVRLCIKSLKDSHEINPVFLRDIAVLILMDDEVGEVNREEEEKIFSYLMRLLQQHKQYIRVDDLHAASVMLFRISDEMIHRIRLHKEDINAEHLLRELEEMICRYLFTTAPR